MRTREEILEELEKSHSKDPVFRIAIEVLLDIRDLLSGPRPGPAEKKEGPDPRSKMTVEEIEKAFAPMLDEIKKKTEK